MDNQSDVREFLRTRRARISPTQAGLPIGTGHRRVTGLRREEVALLAGISVDYYARMERGNLVGVSADVLGNLARALQLDDAETQHLHDLTRAAQHTPSSRAPKRSADHTVRPTLQRFLDAITGTPTWIRNRRMDFIAGDIVATLRSYAAQDPLDRGLTDLIGELVTRSDDFRRRWSAHNVRYHRTGSKRIHHPDVGDLEFAYEAMELPDTPGWTMFAFTTEPGSPSEERVQLLGNLTATTDPARPSPSDRESAEPV